MHLISDIGSVVEMMDLTASSRAEVDRCSRMFEDSGIGGRGTDEAPR